MTELGYEVTVFIPDDAPPDVREAVYDAVEKACDKLERHHGSFKKRKWDLGITGRPVAYTDEP